MDATYRIRDVDVVEAPTVNDVEESADEGEEDEDESIENNDVGGVNMEEGSGDMEKGCHDVADNAVSVNMDVGGGDNEDREEGNEGGEVAGDAGRVNMEEGGGGMNWMMSLRTHWMRWSQVSRRKRGELRTAIPRRST